MAQPGHLEAGRRGASTSPGGKPTGANDRRARQVFQTRSIVNRSRRAGRSLGRHIDRGRAGLTPRDRQTRDLTAHLPGIPLAGLRPAGCSAPLRPTAAQQGEGRLRTAPAWAAAHRLGIRSALQPLLWAWHARARGCPARSGRFGDMTSDYLRRGRPST